MLQTFEANKKFDPNPKKVLIITSFDPIGKQAHPITPKANRKVTLAVNDKRNDIFAEEHLTCCYHFFSHRRNLAGDRALLSWQHF